MMQPSAMQLSKLLYQGIIWRGVNLLSVFILNLVIARAFGSAVYGSLFFIVNFYALALLIASVSLESGLALYTAKNAIGSKQATLFSLIWAVLASGCIIIMVVLFNEGMLLANPLLRPYCFLYLAGNILITFFTALFTAKQHYIIPNTIIAVINTILCVLLLTAVKQNSTADPDSFIKWFLLSFFIEGALMAGYYFFIYRKTAVINTDSSVYKKIFRYALPVFVGNIIFFLVYRVDYWLIDYFIADKGMLGNYIQVSKLVQVFFIIPGIIAATVFSVTAAGHEDKMKKNVQQLSRIIFTAVILICIIPATTGYWLFPFLFGSSFTEMYIPFLLLIPGIAAIATLYPYTAFYAGAGNTVKNIIGSLLALVVILIGDILLIPPFGIAGAAAVCSVGYMLYEAYILLQFKKQYGLTFSDCFVLKKEDFTLLLGIFK